MTVQFYNWYCTPVCTGEINALLTYFADGIIYSHDDTQNHMGWQILLAVPLQAWSGPEGSRKLRFPDFMTKAQDGGKVVSLMHRPPLPPGNTPGTHFC